MSEACDSNVILSIAFGGDTARSGRGRPGPAASGQGGQSKRNGAAEELTEAFGWR
jgi:hypothetical protein